MSKCKYCSDFSFIDPKQKEINMYNGTDVQGNKYYYLDVERPDGFIPEPWRNKRVYYCPLCGRELPKE